VSRLPGNPPDQHAVTTLARQQVWSETANRLKAGIVRARTAGLLLGIAAAVLAMGAVQLADAYEGVARACGVVAGLAAGLTPLVLRRAGTDQVRDWTRARSASEGLKSELYEYLAGGAAYLGGDPARHLAERTRSIDESMGDLLAHTAGVTATPKPMPDVHDAASYVAERVHPQIDHYYRPRAARYQVVVKRLRLVGDALGALAVVLGVAAGAGAPDQLAAWVPVVTTVAASLTAHVAASRYDHQIVEFLRTAQQLEHIVAAHAGGELDDSALVDGCEQVISVENQAWMTNWTKSG
jgi:SMODS and SLOG-associating 2TM effector domain 1/Protein of unknown function (DUF4231)